MRLSLRCALPLVTFLAGAAATLPLTRQDPADHGMQQYTLGFFRPGPKLAEESTALGKEKMAELQKAHLDGLDAMARTGKLIFAGPFVDRPGADAAQGMLLFEKATKAEIEAMVAKDAFVEKKMLRLELLRFWGPKGVTYPDRSKYYDPKPTTTKPTADKR